MSVFSVSFLKGVNMFYYGNNYKLCRNVIISDSVTVVAIDGTDTLVIDIPAGSYVDGCRYEIVVAQTIPDTATINMLVAVSIGGDTTTVYPLVKCDCSQITACAIRSRTKYPVLVSTNAVGGVFKVLRKLPCYPNNRLESLPVPATEGGAVTPAVLSVRSTATRTNTKKEANANE